MYKRVIARRNQTPILLYTILQHCNASFNIYVKSSHIMVIKKPKCATPTIPKKQVDLLEMQKLVDVALSILSNDNDLDDFGRLLHETWKIKRSLTSSIEPDYIEEIYSKGMKAGALGGKLLGAGGGGFIIFYVAPEKKQQVLDALNELLLVPFRLENDGARILFDEAHSYSFTAVEGTKEFFKGNM